MSVTYTVEPYVAPPIAPPTFKTCLLPTRWNLTWPHPSPRPRLKFARYLDGGTSRGPTHRPAHFVSPVSYPGGGAFFLVSEPPGLDVAPPIAPAPRVGGGCVVLIGGGGVAPLVVVVVVFIVITSRLFCCVVVDPAGHWEIPTVKSDEADNQKRTEPEKKNNLKQNGVLSARAQSTRKGANE